MLFQTREKTSRSVSPANRSDLVTIIPRSQSPAISKEQL